MPACIYFPIQIAFFAFLHKEKAGSSALRPIILTIMQV